MGLVLDKMCCAESEDLIKEGKLNGSFFQSKMDMKNGFNKSSLPLSEISFNAPKKEEQPQYVGSLSRLPITTQNVIRQKLGSPFQYYDEISMLGHGSFGNVLKVMHKQSGNIRSMKIIPKNNLRPGFTPADIESEINILKKLEHPHIIKIYEFFSDESNYYLINEFCTEGDLSSKLSQLNSFPECIVKVLMFQIFSAVSYLHSNRVIHGDLKLENIMVDSNLSPPNRKRGNSFVSSIREDAKTIRESFTFERKRSQVIGAGKPLKNVSSPTKFRYSKMKNFDLKLIDFGCARIFTHYKQSFQDTIGTLVYCSPEVLLNDYDEKCDIWSCGVIMYILLSGKLPFYGKTEEEITKKILNGKFSFPSRDFQEVSQLAKDLIKMCLTYDKKNRISVKEALKHPFFLNDLDPHNIFQEELNCREVLNSLKKNSKHSKFYQVVLAFLSHNFANKEQLDRLKKIFLSIDLDLDGKISLEELKKAYERNGILVSEEQIKEILASIDFDNNGSIEYEEFIRVTVPKELLFTEGNLKLAFDLFDEDKNGVISLNEIRQILGMEKNVDQKVVDELSKEIQKVTEGEITFEHFKQIMLSVSDEPEPMTPRGSLVEFRKGNNEEI